MKTLLNKRGNYDSHVIVEATGKIYDYSRKGDNSPNIQYINILKEDSDWKQKYCTGSEVSNWTGNTCRMRILDNSHSQ